jgi:hypothetical protein
MTAGLSALSLAGRAQPEELEVGAGSDHDIVDDFDFANSPQVPE